MANNTDNVRVAVTGAISKGATTEAAPTGTSGAVTGFVDLGYIGEDGVEITLPDSGDATPIKAWGGDTVRVVRTPSDDNPSWAFTMLETNLTTVETYFGVTVTQTATEGSFEYTVAARDHNSYVIDAIDGAELIRDYIPYGIVTAVEAHTLATGEAIGYGVTIEGELGAAGFNFKRWSTALKSVA